MLIDKARFIYINHILERSDEFLKEETFMSSYLFLFYFLPTVAERWYILCKFIYCIQKVIF